MAAVGVLHRVESTTGPVAVAGRTLTLVSRTRALRLGGDRWGWFHIRSRPSHVEVLERDGARRVVRIHDLHRLATAAILAVATACVVGTRGRRNR